MNQTPKKLVSKSEYAKLWGVGIGIEACAMCLLLLAAISGMVYSALFWVLFVVFFT